MTSKEVISIYDEFRQNARDYIYSVCSHNGVIVPQTKDECGYYRLQVDIKSLLIPYEMGLAAQNSHKDIFDPARINEIRAYIGEGWIYVVVGDYEPVDIEDLSAEDIIRILNAISA